MAFAIDFGCNLFPVFTVLEVKELLGDLIHIVSKLTTVCHGCLEQRFGCSDLKITNSHVTVDVGSHSIIQKVCKLVVDLKAVLHGTTLVFASDSIIPASSEFGWGHAVS